MFLKKICLGRQKKFQHFRWYKKTLNWSSYQSSKMTSSPKSILESITTSHPLTPLNASLIQNETEATWKEHLEETYDELDKAYHLSKIIPVAFFLFWIFFSVCYLHLIFGRAITILGNWLLDKSQNQRFNLGSLSISPLSGMIIFRQLSYVEQNYSVHIDYGIIYFSFWRLKTEDRFMMSFRGFDMHIFNRTEWSFQKLFVRFQTGNSNFSFGNDLFRP